MTKFADLLKDSKKEIEEKTEHQIEHETALKWASRAVAYYQAGDVERGEDCEHEAVEHAALVMDHGETVKEVQNLIEKYKK